MQAVSVSQLFLPQLRKQANAHRSYKKTPSTAAKNIGLIFNIW